MSKSSSWWLIVFLIFGLAPLIWLLGGPMVGLYPPPYPDASRALIILLAVLSAAMINILAVGIAGAQSMPRGHGRMRWP